MRIVQLIDYFQQKVGYQETFLSQQLKRLGHEILTVTSDRYYPFANFEKTYGRLLGNRTVGKGRKLEESIEVIRLPALEIPKTPLLILLGLKKTLAELKPDLVYCHGVYSLTSYLAAKYKKNLGYKLVYDTHAASFNTNFDNSLPKKLFHLIHKKFISGKIKDAKDLIFAVGDNERKFICDDFRLPDKDVPVIRLGVDTDWFKFTLKSRIMIRKKLGFEKDDVVIVYSGKITENKDVHILCESVKLLNNNHVKLLLIGGGEGKYIAKLKRISGQDDNLLHLNFVENKNLPLYYSASDIGCWPGDFSISILEALSCGLPVVIPEIWYTSYLKDNGVMTYKRGDAKRLSEVLAQLIYNKKLRHDLGKTGSNYIRKELSWKKITEKFLSLLP